MLWRRTNFSLLLAAAITGACGHGAAEKPELPSSVSPGWQLRSMAHSGKPAGVPDGGAPDCWRGQYSGPGTAEVWVCRYAQETGAFEAVQRTPAEADTVKFQQGDSFVLVRWKSATRDDASLLVRGVQKALKR